VFEPHVLVVVALAPGVHSCLGVDGFLEALEKGDLGNEWKFEQHSDEWFEAREQCFITSSQVHKATLLSGIYKDSCSSCHAWLRQKKGLDTPKTPGEQSLVYMNYGTENEHKARDRFLEAFAQTFDNPLGIRVLGGMREFGLCRRDFLGVTHGASVDGYVQYQREGDPTIKHALIEIKTPYPHPHRGASQGRKDAVPLHEWMQVQHQLLVMGLEDAFFLAHYVEEKRLYFTHIKFDASFCFLLVNYCRVLQDIVDDKHDLEEVGAPHLFQEDKYTFTPARKKLWLQNPVVEDMQHAVEQYLLDPIKPEDYYSY
jgi:hypothetical protein